MAEAAKGKKSAATPAAEEPVEAPKAPRASKAAETALPAVAEVPAVTDVPAVTEVPAEDHVPVTADTRSAFQAALERKKQAGQARSAHLDGHGGVGGATSSHKATRTFRRKSGSA